MISGLFLLLGVGWVIANHFVLHEVRGDQAYLPEVAVDLLIVGAVTAVLLLLQRRIARSEARFLASAGRFQQLTDGSPDLVYRLRLRPAFAVEYMSPAAVAITGHEPAEFYADPDLLGRLVHPGDAAGVRDAIAAGGNALRATTLRWRRDDGSTVWTEGRAVLISDDRGRLVAVEGYARDISSRITAEESLREREAQLRRVLDVSPVGLVIHQDGALAFVNPMAGHLFGAPQPGRLIGTAWLERIDPRDRSLVAQRTRAVLAGESEPPIAEERLLRADGSPFEAEVATAPLHWVGRPAVLVAIRDVTERVASERAVRASEERFRRITQAITDDFYSLRVEAGRGAIVMHGPGCQAVTGYTAEELGSDAYPLFSVVVPEDRESLMAQAESALAGGNPGPVEHRIVRKDGSLRWLRNTVVPQQDEAGAVVAYDGLINDVTEQRLIADQLRQAQKMEAVGQLAGGIAHDFNNLLTAIRGYADLARSTMPDDDLARADIDQVIVAADRAGELTSQLLAFSRRQVLQPRVLDAAAVTIGLAPMLRRLLGEHIELDISGARSRGRVKADPGQLEQVVVNLAVNAGDAMPAGGRLLIETADIELNADYVSTHADASPGSYVLLTISDTGIGMDAATLARAFEPFFTTKGLGKGTGMGLATVYGIVKQSGGSVHLYSEPGEGTTFRIYLPRVDEPVAPEAAAELAPSAGAGETIMLVEDDLTVRRYAGRVLAARGYVVLEASAGPEALELAGDRSLQIHLLVTDVVMPGMSGRDLALRLTANRPGLPVLFVSGFPETQLDESVLAVPGVAFLPKPYSADALARSVRAILGTHQERA